MSEGQTYSEKDLLLRIAGGDERAFGSFYKATYRLFFNITINITRDQYQAGHIVSQCFVKLWDRKETFKALADMRAFLYVACTNAAKDFLRTAKRNPEIAASSIRDRDQKDPTEENILYTIIRTEMLDEVYRAIQTLPAQQRAVMNAIYIQNLSIDEAAKSLKISVENVRSHKRYALAHLRKILPLKKWLALLLIPVITHG